MKITTTKATSRFVKAVVYGEAGVGKTVLGSTAPKPIIISAERGLLSLADKDIAVIEVESFGDALKAFDYVKANDAYETIVLDSLSEIAEKMLAEFKKYEKDGRQAYLKLADELYSLARKFRDIDKHILFIAKQELTKDEVTGKTTYRPSAPGQAFTAQIPYFVDEVFCMRIGKVDKEMVRYLQTQPDLQYTAKDRSGKLAAKEDPNLTAIFNKIVGN